MLSQLGQVVVQLADNVMVGWLGAVSLAAVSFGGAIYFPVFVAGLGLAMGLTPIIGGMFVQRNHFESARYFQNSIVLYTISGCLLTGLLFAAIPLMHHMGQSPEVVVTAIPYFRYLAWSMIPLMLFSAFKQFLEGIGNTKVAMYIIIISNAVNIALNYLLIYGKLGFPEMGAAGAGLATLISRIIMPPMIIVYFFCNHSLRRYLGMFRGSYFNWRSTRELLRVGAPISLQMVLETLAFALSSIMIGWLGAIALAANQITIAMANMAFMIVIGISAATTIRVSHEMGRGDLRQAKRAANASYHMGFVYNLVMGMLFIALRNYIPLIFTNDPHVVEEAAYLLIFAGVFQISDGMQVISLGILRGMKDVNYPMVIALVSYILVNLPLGYLFGFVFEWGAGGVWMGYIGGLGLAAVLLNWRYRHRYRMLREASMII